MQPLTTLLLVWALFAQVILVVVILLKMRVARVNAYKDGKVTMADIAVNHNAWPENVRQVQNSYANQFELPVLFFVAVLLALHFGQNDWVVVILSWAFVLTRWVHMFIHTSTNHIPTRFKAFFAGMLLVTILWIYIVLSVTF